MKLLLLRLLAACIAFSFTALTEESKQPSAPPPGKAAFKNVDVASFEKMRAAKDTVVLDVRTKAEFDAGHIPGAVNVDVKSADFDTKTAKLDKSKTYLVHCAAGGRSVTACNKLAPLKFEHLYNLEGGYKAWEKAGHKGEK